MLHLHKKPKIIFNNFFLKSFFARFNKKKSINKFGKSELLFRRAANTGGVDHIKKDVIDEISCLIRNKNKKYYKALSQCVAYVDSVYCTGIVWYKPDNTDDDEFIAIMREFFKAYFFYMCDMPVKIRYFVGDVGHTFIKEDGVHLFTFYHVDYAQLRSQKAFPKSFIVRIKTKKDAKLILTPKAQSIKDFILFSAEYSTSEEYKYTIDDTIIEVSVGPKLKLLK